jgi:nucleotide-binding universal stress UspA family protein
MEAKSAGAKMDTPLSRIVHPSDFSASSRVAFAHALKLALLCNSELELVHVQPHRTGSEDDVHWSDFPEVRATLARWRLVRQNATTEEFGKLGLRVKKVLSAERDALEAMVHYCEQHPPDLLVLATHQREGLARWVHKAVAEPLARRSRAMTLFIPQSSAGFVSSDDGTVSLRRILIPVDHVPSAQAALEEAFFLAALFERRGVVFKLLHVGTELGMPRLYLPHRPGWRWEESLVPGDPVERILADARQWRPDLLTMATQGHTGFLDAWRGSTTEQVLRGVGCPVLAVPARRD